MNFSTQIDLGNVITLVGFIVTLLTLHRQNIRRLSRIDFRVGLMWKDFSKRFDVSDKDDDDVSDS